MRRAARERWRVRRAEWAISDAGYGHAVYSVGDAAARPIASSPSRRRSRIRGEPIASSPKPGTRATSSTTASPTRMRSNACAKTRRCRKPAAIARATSCWPAPTRASDCSTPSSTRLARGEQPDAALLASVGYLMRTTAVYGNGKFGIADREEIAERPELSGPFQAEMLTVWLIRSFTIDLAEHIAARRAPERAARLSPALRRGLGVGNATGLGMAPFLVRHPVLMHNWFHAREAALARVRSQPQRPRRRAGWFSGRPRRHAGQGSNLAHRRHAPDAGDRRARRRPRHA